MFNIKHVPTAVLSTLVRDFEMSQADAIEPNPWQTDACIGGWHYSRSLLENHRYRTPESMVQLLVNVVSKNGNLLLNIPLPGHGRPDDDELAFLDKFGAWMALNSEAIYSTRPWKIAGEGPTQAPAARPMAPLPQICSGRHAVYHQGRRALRHRAGLARGREADHQIARCPVLPITAARSPGSDCWGRSPISCGRATPTESQSICRRSRRAITRTCSRSTRWVRDRLAPPPVSGPCGA